MSVRCINIQLLNYTLQVCIGYKKPKTYHLTPSRKRIGKSLARGSRCALVRECFKDEIVRKYIIKKVGNMVHHEIVSLCSDRVNSTLLNPPTKLLSCLTWEGLYSELIGICPILTQILKCGTETRHPRTNQRAIILLCISIMCNQRCKSMSLVQQIISVLLYSGHCSKQVSLLYRVQICLTHTLTVDANKPLIKFLHRFSPS